MLAGRGHAVDEDQSHRYPPGEVLPPSRLQPLAPTVRPNQRNRLTEPPCRVSLPIRVIATPASFPAPYRRRSREQQLIVLPTIQSKLNPTPFAPPASGCTGSAASSTSAPTPDSAHRCPRSVDSPSLKSIQALASPRRRRASPTATRGSGNKCGCSLNSLANPRHPAPRQHPLQLRRRPTQPPRAIQPHRPPGHHSAAAPCPAEPSHQRNIRQHAPAGDSAVSPPASGHPYRSPNARSPPKKSLHPTPPPAR